MNDRTTPHPSAETEEELSCCKCGSTERLHPDPDMDDIYYCEDCFQRFQIQQIAIREGYEVNPDVGD